MEDVSCDMSTLEDILVCPWVQNKGINESSGVKLSKNRDECRRAAVYGANLHETWEEITHNNLPVTGRASTKSCFVVVEVNPVVYDDESRNPAELVNHPDKEDILPLNQQPRFFLVD